MNSKLTLEKQMAFIAVLSETCIVAKACEAIGITRQTAHNWRNSYPDFKEAWLTAEKVGSGVLGDEITRRALEGQDEVTFVDGVAAKVVRKFDNKLLLAAHRAHNPEKYHPLLKPEEPSNIRAVPNLSEMCPKEIMERLNKLKESVLARLEDEDAESQVEEPDDHSDLC